MSHSDFTAEQLAQVAHADTQQTKLLRSWLITAHDRRCDRNNSHVSRTGRGSSRPCRECAARLEYSLDDGAIDRRVCAAVRHVAPGRAT